MTPEVRLIQQLVPVAARLGRIVLLSPSEEERALFPGAEVLNTRDWDLRRARPQLRADLIVACQAFHSAAEPARAFENVLASCRALLCLERFRAKRVSEADFGREDYPVRFNLGDSRAPMPSGLELLPAGARLLCQRVFDGGNDQAAGMYFAALIEGNLKQPLLRIDDYPTGVRPIAKDLGPLHEVLFQFESRGLAYHLGIVPAITEPEMFAQLKALRHMVPVQHGYEHKYAKFSALLIRRGDPENAKGTVGAFNEFAWQRYATVEKALTTGKQRLEAELERAIDIYIPPCNRCDRSTARVLAQLGFRLCLSERTAPGAFLPTLRSDFYGRSTDVKDDFQVPEVVSLHATWEADLLRSGQTTALPRLLDAIEANVRSKSAAVAALADALEHARAA